MTQRSRPNIGLALLLIGLIAYIGGCKVQSEAQPLTFATAQNPVGLKPADCWVEAQPGWPKMECYRMQVHENHLAAQDRLVTFPLVIFRTPRRPASTNPVLHLGAGGPGAAMHLDSADSLAQILQDHDQFSLDQGRDLYLIDPRGSGLASPLLTCDRFVEHEVERLAQNLSFVEDLKSGDWDYIECIDYQLRQGIDFNHYNSAAIVHDIDALRRATGVGQWVLVGVSYAAVYAQILDRYFPGSIESMILDSPAFPDRKLHHNYLRRVMAPYDMLFKYCGDEDGCSDPRESRQLQRAFWNLYHELNRSPLRVVVKNPYTGRRLPVVLNGERFLGAVSEGVYGSEIFRQLKHILHDLEDGDTRSLYPYLKSYLVFLLDQTYGDLSAEAHYCHETKPFTDFDLIRRLSDELPAGYIRATAKLSIDWPDNCAQMAVTAGAPDLAQALETDTPTLFLQGTLDTITPLSDVEARRESFSNGALLTFDLSHDVLGSSTCAEALVADFVRTGVMQDKAVACD